MLIAEVAKATGILITALCLDRDRATTIAILYMVFVMCAGGYFVNLASLPSWLGWLRYTSFWYYAIGLFSAYALPTGHDRATFVANGTLERYSFSTWTWDGHPERDIIVLVALALVQHALALVALKHSKQLQFR